MKKTVLFFALLFYIQAVHSQCRNTVDTVVTIKEKLYSHSEKFIGNVIDTIEVYKYMDSRMVNSYGNDDSPGYSVYYLHLNDWQDCQKYFASGHTRKEALMNAIKAIHTTEICHIRADFKDVNNREGWMRFNPKDMPAKPVKPDPDWRLVETGVIMYKGYACHKYVYRSKHHRKGTAWRSITKYYPNTFEGNVLSIRYY